MSQDASSPDLSWGGQGRDGLRRNCHSRRVLRDPRELESRVLGVFNSNEIKAVHSWKQGLMLFAF